MNDELLKLYAEIEEANHNYYTLDEPLISDEEYDEKYARLKKLEEKYPDQKLKNSPTEKVGATILNKFEKVEHRTPMLSLNNAFSIEDVRKFSEDVMSALTSDDKVEYVCEVKIDGLAISIHYDLTIDVAATRGDGKIGENVTTNVITIKELPKFVEYNDLEVRGEVYISREQFMKINAESPKKYANPRNLAAGSIRQLDSKIAQGRNLQLFSYGLVSPEKYEITNYYDSMKFIEKLGFPINSELKKVDSIEKIMDYIETITENRDKLAYEIDGIVIKVNDYQQQERIGYTAKYPKWAIAYKFKSTVAITRLKEIFWTVGKTGKITPNAVLEPVNLMGSEIARASLYNLEYIKEKKIVPNSDVEIKKAGDVIPRVEAVVKYYDDIIKVPTIESCPGCGGKIIQIENDLYCADPNCTSVRIEKIKYFVGKSAFDINGFGEQRVELFFEKGIIKDVTDIFNLNYEMIENLDGFGKKSIANLKEGIEASKIITLPRFLNALSIGNVGLETAINITEVFPTLVEVMTATFDDLLQVEKVGDIIAAQVVKYFKEEENRAMIDLLLSSGVIISEAETITVDEDNKFNGKIVVITGKFINYNRDQLKETFKQKGAKVSGSISSKTDYLIVGENAGSKLEKAESLGTIIITEAELQGEI